MNAVTATNGPVSPPGTATYQTISETLEQLGGELKDRLESLKAFLLALGDDVKVKTLKLYLAFKRIKNFACVEIRTQEKKLLIYAKLDPAAITLEDGFTRDVSNIGHYGTGDLEITIRNTDDFERAKPLLVQAYEGS